MSKAIEWSQQAKRPVIIVLVVSLLLIIVNLYVAQRFWSYNSDDVTWQTILMSWHPFNGHAADVGSKDNFVINAPILWLFGRLFSPSRTLLFVEATLFAIINFIFFYASGVYLLKRFKMKLTLVSLLPFLWLAGFGYSFSTLFLNTNWRNFEVGLSFGLFALAVKVYIDSYDLMRSWVSRLLTVLVSFSVGVLVYCDPYFLYFSVAPILILYVVLFLLKKISRTQAITVVLAMMLSLVVARMLEKIMALAGIFTPQTGAYKITSLDALQSSIPKVVSGLLTIFSANFSNLHVMSWAFAVAFANLWLLITVGAMLVYSLWKHRHLSSTPTTGKRWLPLLLIAFLGLLCIWGILANVAYRNDDYRYFLSVVYALTLFLAVVLHDLDDRKWVYNAVAVVMLLSIAAGTLNTVSLAEQPVAQSQNARNYQLVSDLKGLGLNKGYAGYWDGDVNTYFSNGAIKFLPISCVSGRTVQANFLVDTSLFSQQASRSFYIVNPQSSWPTCTKAQVIAQFGKPQQTVTVLDQTVLIYNYDLHSRIPQ